VPPSNRVRPLVPLALWSALAGPALLALPAAPAHAAVADGIEIGVAPWLQYRFTTTLGNGEQAIEELPTQVGGEIDAESDPEPIPKDMPEMAASINEGAKTFWVQALSPQASPDPGPADPVRYASRVFITQSFRKEEEDATLAYVMSAAHVIGLDPSAAGDDLGPSGSLSFSLDLTSHGPPVVDNVFHAAGFVGITGLGRAWRPDPAPAGTGSIPLEITAGAFNQSYLELKLLVPYRVEVDLSDILVGKEFTIRYALQAECGDTKQLDTGCDVYARDPLEAGSGNAFYYTGLMPTDNPIVVPEPGRTALLLAGGAVLLGLRGASRRSRPGPPGRSPGRRGLARELAAIRAFPISHP
jgi:hypothetical protein